MFYTTNIQPFGFIFYCIFFLASNKYTNIFYFILHFVKFNFFFFNYHLFFAIFCKRACLENIVLNECTNYFIYSLEGVIYYFNFIYFKSIDLFGFDVRIEIRNIFTHHK